LDLSDDIYHGQNDTGPSITLSKYFRWDGEQEKQGEGREQHGFNYMDDTRWIFQCALLKERILDLFLENDYAERVQMSQFVHLFLLITT